VSGTEAAEQLAASAAERLPSAVDLLLSSIQDA